MKNHREGRRFGHLNIAIWSFLPSACVDDGMGGDDYSSSCYYLVIRCPWMGSDVGARLFCSLRPESITTLRRLGLLWIIRRCVALRLFMVFLRSIGFTVAVLLRVDFG